MSLRETRLVIFGSPAAGTPVMVAATLAALDLPPKTGTGRTTTARVVSSRTPGLAGRTPRPDRLARRDADEQPVALTARVAGLTRRHCRGLRPVRRAVLRRAGLLRVRRLRHRQASRPAVPAPGRGDFRCSIHGRAAAERDSPAAPATTASGRGQHVSQGTFGGRDWRQAPAITGGHVRRVRGHAPAARTALVPDRSAGSLDGGRGRCTPRLAAARRRADPAAPHGSPAELAALDRGRRSARDVTPLLRGREPNWPVVIFLPNGT